jgi:hypothetical protein
LINFAYYFPQDTFSTTELLDQRGDSISENALQAVKVFFFTALQAVKVFFFYHTFPSMDH